MKALIYLFIVGSLLYILFSWFRIVTTTAPDFSVYYGAAQRLAMHKSLSGATGLYTGFGYPPTTLLLFLPLLLLPYHMAQTVWVTISFLLIPVCVYLSLRLKEGREGVVGREGLEKIILWSCIFFWTFPARFTLGMGQINLVSLAFLLTGVVSLASKKKGNSIIWFTLLLVSKPHFILLIPFLFLLGYRKQMIATVVGYSGLTLLTAGIFGVNYFVTYVVKELPPLMAFAGREIYYNQSLSAFLSRVLPLGAAKYVTDLGIIGLLSGLAIIVLSITGEKKQKLIILFSFFLPIFVLVEPLGWQHHIVFVLPVFLWLTKERLTITELVWMTIAFFLISLNIKNPLPLYGGDIVSRGLVLSHAFWGITILLVLGYFHFRKQTEYTTSLWKRDRIPKEQY